MQFVDQMRALIQQSINEDPWTCTVYREPAEGGTVPTTFSFTGKIFPVAHRTMAITRGSTLEAIARADWGMIAPYDTQVLRGNDRVKCVQDTITRWFVLLWCNRYPTKLESWIEEIQG